MGVFKNRANLLLGVIIALAAALLFTNLDNHYLWQDEAQTALIAATVLERGVPLGYDGKNYFSQEGGAEYGPDYIWKWHPWFPFYYLALFFGLFGVSTFTARLPFVLIALLTVVLTYAAGRSLWQCRRAGLSAALLLSCTIPFLLLARQCRYYAPATFFALAVLYCYWNGAQKKKRYAVLLFVAGTLLFHTNFVYCAAALVAVLAHAVLLRRRDLKRTVSVCVLIVVVNAPWFLWIADIDYAGRYGGLNAAMLPEALQRYGWYVWEHCFSVFIIPVAAVVGGWTLFRNRKVFLGDGSTRSAAALFLLFLLCCSCYAVSCCRPFVITRRFFVIVRRSCRSAVC